MCVLEVSISCQVVSLLKAQSMKKRDGLIDQLFIQRPSRKKITVELGHFGGLAASHEEVGKSGQSW